MPSNWWVPSQPLNNVPGSAVYGGGGSIHSQNTAGVVQFRSNIDAERSAAGQLPYAEYPDGYLGTIVDRHEDKLLAKVQEKLSDRSYQRGIHVGYKISNEDYFWNKNIVDPQSRLRAEARAKKTGYTMSVERHAPTGSPIERLAHLGKTAGLSPPEQIGLYKQYGVSMARNPVVLNDPDRQARLQKMRPPYAW